MTDLILSIAVILAAVLTSAAFSVNLSQDTDDMDDAYRTDGQAAPAPSGIVYTVSGMLKKSMPAVDRPGCVLELTDGTTTGRYYVPLDSGEVSRTYRKGSPVRLRMDGTMDQANAAYETIGTHDTDWSRQI